MTMEQWLLLIALGGVCGLLGQAVRVIVGLAKRNAANAAHQAAVAANQPNPPPAEPFNGALLLVTLLIGFVAGALAAIAAQIVGTVFKPTDPKTVLALIAAGYSGTDFIEAFMSKWLPAA